MLAELGAMFIEDSAKLMAEIAEAIRDDDRASLRRAAHSLKGSLGIFGAASAAEAARQLEALGREGEIAGAGVVCASLQDEMRRLMPALTALSISGEGIA